MKSKALGAFYRSLFDHTLDGLAYCQMIFDQQGNPVDFMYLRVNGNFETLTGLKEATGKKVTALIPGIKTSNPELFEIYGRVSVTGKSERFETHLKPLSRWFLVSVYSPKKGFFVAVFQNITERKQIEENFENAKIAARNVLEDLQVEKDKLAEVNAKDEAILQNIGEGVLAIDLERRILFINNTGEDLLGWKRKDIIGTVINNLPLEDKEGHLIPLEERPTYRAIQEGKAVIVDEYFFVRSDKTKFAISITVTPIRLNERTTGAIAIFRDITRGKEVDKAKSEFVSLASHQFRTPTAAIKWYSEMLLGEEVGAFNEKQKEYLTEIRHANQRMIDLVNTLLSVSRIELGTFAIQPKPTNIALVADDVLKELENQVNQKGLVVEKEYKKEGSSIQSDERSIRIIVQNLLSNAVAYTPPKGKISIGIRRSDIGTRLEVRDTGCGIPRNARSKIYTKFFRADNARAIQPDGTGLGLYLTKTITEALGGTIDFKSEEKGGTAFSVDIPDRNIAE